MTPKPLTSPFSRLEIIGLIGSLLLFCSVAQAAPPINDNFGSAFVIPSRLPASFVSTNVEATKELGEPNAAGVTGGFSIWWQFTSTQTTSYTIDTANSNFDTILGVYTGSSVNTLSELASNDDNGSTNTSKVVVDIPEGTKVYIQVDSFANVQGSVRLNISSPPPPNDNFANAIALPGTLSVFATGYNVSATTENQEPNPTQFYNSNSTIWWTYNVPASGNYIIRTTGSSFDTVLTVYSGNTLSTLRQIGFNDDAGGTFESEIPINLTAGMPLAIQVDGYEGIQGYCELTLFAEVPGNDANGSAFQNIDALPTTVQGTNLTATKQPLEPDHANNPGGASVWWTFVLPEAGNYIVDTLGSDFDTLLAVYNASSGGVLAQNDDSEWNTQSRVSFTVAAPTTIQVAVDGFSGSQGNIRLTVSPESRNGGVQNNDENNSVLLSTDGWLPLGQSGGLFTADIGSRGYDGDSSALTAFVAPSPRGRVIGWIEDPVNDLPYSAIGPTKFVRAKYSVYYSGPGDSASPTLYNRVPNYRFSLRSRGVVTTQLEINHNAQIAGSPAQSSVTRELGPSKIPGRPSLYRVDFDPVDAPHWTNSTTEGIQRGFETVVSGADYSFVEGVLNLTDTSIATYPAPQLSSTPQKSFGPGQTPGAADFDNSTIVLAKLGYSASEIFRYVAGPSQADYFNPNILNFTINSESGASISKQLVGIRINSSGLPTSRIAVMDAALNGGVFGDTDATRLRVEPQRMYVATFRLNHFASSNSTPYIRLGARSVGFGYNATLELLGARGLPPGDGRTALAQVLPGTGNQLPTTTIESNSFYNLVFSSPINSDIRPDVIGNLQQKFPNLTSQPGPNVNSPSLRNINFAFTVADSLSLVNSSATDSNEAASELYLTQIAIRSFVDVAD